MTKLCFLFNISFSLIIFNSYSKAKECNAVKHCIQTVWMNQVLPEDNDDVCEICKNMVKEARDQLLSNETQVSYKFIFLCNFEFHL